MIARDQRLVMMAENDPDDIPWYLPAFAVMQETPYSFEAPADGRGALARPPTDPRMERHVTTTVPLPPLLRVTLLGAGIVIIAAGLHGAAASVNIVLVSFLLAMTMYPISFLLCRRGMQRGLAVMVTVAIVLVGGMLLISWLAASLTGMADKLPAYEARLSTRLASLTERLAARGIVLSDVLQPDPERVMGFVGLQGLLGAVQAMIHGVAIQRDRPGVNPAEAGPRPRVARETGVRSRRLGGIHPHSLVWTTRERQPLVDAPAAEFLQRYLRAAARQERARIVALGVVQTHVHVLFEAGTTTSLPRLVQRFKGGSSASINREGRADGPTPLRWAKGYTIHTVGTRGLRAARAYVENQGARRPRERIAFPSAS